MRYTAHYNVFKPMLGRYVAFRANFWTDYSAKARIEVFDTNHFCAISQRQDTFEEAYEDLRKIMRIGLPPFSAVLEARRILELPTKES
jgi:hypothetical protein